jgi:hypothetical protein
MQPSLATPKYNALLFQIMDSNQPPLESFPSPFILLLWEALLSHLAILIAGSSKNRSSSSNSYCQIHHLSYPWSSSSFLVTLVGILKYGCQIGYNGPLQFILSQNLKSAQIDQSAISSRLILDLALRWVVSRTPVLSIHPFSTWANTKAEQLSLHPPSPPLTHPQTYKLYALKSTNLTRLRCRLS